MKLGKYHLFCKANHWKVSESGQLLLDTPLGEQKNEVRRLVSVLEQAVRIQCHAEVMAHNFTENRKQLIRNGIEKVPAYVQQVCADSLLAKYAKRSSDEETKSESVSIDTSHLSNDGNSATSESPSADTPT